MHKSIRVLIVEDVEDDALLMVRQLQKGGYEPEFERVDTAEAMREALALRPWDLIISDYRLPSFDGLAALEIFKEMGGDIPFILVSGAIGEETAVEAMKAGAHDCIKKDNLARLVPAVERELREAKSRARRRQAEMETLKARREWEDIFQAISHPTFILDPHFGIVAANKSAAGVAGMAATEMTGRKCYEIFHAADSVSPPQGCPMQRLIVSGDRQTVEAEIQALGKNYIVCCTPVFDEQGCISRVIHIATDITERHKAEEALRESEMRYRSLVDKSIAGVYVVQDGRFVFISANAASFAGYESQELIGKPSVSIVHPEDLGHVEKRAFAMMRGEETSPHEFRIVTKGGQTRWIMEATTAIQYGGRRAVLGNSMDITEIKLAQERLREAEERYRGIFENAREGIYRSTPDGRIILANPAMAGMFGYASPEEMKASVTDIAQQHYVDPQERDKIKAIVEARGYVSNYEVRLYHRDGSTFWASMSARIVRDEQGKVLYYEGIDENITERKQNQERMRKALGATVQAISMAVEMKDPYTAGHQRRTADLARAIAREMGLPAERSDFIRVAATIHDIGKIGLPAEILSKPSKLTTIEYALIRTHAQLGYDILKGIEFPWPVADLVLQHHERSDGSGYPNGLRGDEMLLESRIMVVADVVEAVASHRPYRPALGIDAALEEIEKYRGVIYDAAVVEACLRLFRQQGYILPV